MICHFPIVLRLKYESFHKYFSSLKIRVIKYFVLQSRGGGTSLATAVLEDEVLAEQGEEASLLSGCRALLRSVTKVREELQDQTTDLAAQSFLCIL